MDVKKKNKSKQKQIMKRNKESKTIKLGNENMQIVYKGMVFNDAENLHQV